MNDEHVYHGENDSEKDQWKRVFTIPTASVDSKLDPFDEVAFTDATKNKKRHHR